MGHQGLPNVQQSLYHDYLPRIDTPVEDQKAQQTYQDSTRTKDMLLNNMHKEYTHIDRPTSHDLQESEDAQLLERACH